MDPLFGIETEYGIAVEGRGAADLEQESLEVVRSYVGRSVGAWNYRGEDPRLDMRGFAVDRLATNPDDAQFDAPGTPPGAAYALRSDRVLANGARLYNDHGHPEYATPECGRIADIVAHDRAGECIVRECARRRTETLGRLVQLIKNNTDFHGASYGCHESYLMRRDVPADDVIRCLAPFLATRQLLCGAGKVGTEAHRGSKGNYQLSQRADFVSVEASIDTLHNRPLVNTRDEPHAVPASYRRLHVIVGDANMSQWATAMKLGTTAMAVSLLEAGWRPRAALGDPVAAVRAISADLAMDGAMSSRIAGEALAVQREFADAASFELLDAWADSAWVIREWRTALDDLAADPARLADRADWAAKLRMLEEYRSCEDVSWSDPVLCSLDLAYHDLDQDAGLFWCLEEAGLVRRIVEDSAISAATLRPPEDTRAFARGWFVEHYADAVTAIGWNGVAFRYAGEDWLFDMNALVDGCATTLNAGLAQTRSLTDVVDLLGRQHLREHIGGKR